MNSVKVAQVIIFAVVTGLICACASTPHLPESVRPEVTTAAAPGASFFKERDPGDAGLKEVINADTEVRPGFLIRLISPHDHALVGKYRVAADGVLHMPYDVTIVAVGLSLGNLEVKINESYRKYFKREPQLRVELVEIKYWIEVGGLVKKPGKFLVAPHLSIDQVMNLAGGVLPAAEQAALGSAELRTLRVTQGQNRFYVDLKTYFQGVGNDSLPQWRGGEAVWIGNASADAAVVRPNSLEIIGDVRSPGTLAFKEGADLYTYLAEAGGPVSGANLEKINVVRMTAQGRATTTGSAEEIAKNIRLEQGDMIIIESSHPGLFERNLQAGTTLASIISAIGILILVF